VVVASCWEDMCLLKWMRRCIMIDEDGTYEGIWESLAWFWRMEKGLFHLI
jgi:hypothetical protein